MSVESKHIIPNVCTYNQQSLLCALQTNGVFFPKLYKTNERIFSTTKKCHFDATQYVEKKNTLHTHTKRCKQETDEHQKTL